MWNARYKEDDQKRRWPQQNLHSFSSRSMSVLYKEPCSSIYFDIVRNDRIHSSRVLSVINKSWRQFPAVSLKSRKLHAVNSPEGGGEGGILNFACFQKSLNNHDKVQNYYDGQPFVKVLSTRARGKNPFTEDLIVL